jgi:hypothetical protein
MTDARPDSGSTHAPRPIDLVALVTFDDAVYENQAVTRERLARPHTTPPALNAAIEQWLVRRRHMWIDVNGRQINGIATARSLAADDAWIIDTLIDASDAADAAHESGVVLALLDQAIEAARQSAVTRLLLRTPADAPALAAALRTGFQPALSERLWAGSTIEAPASPSEGVTVREAGDGDAFELFQLFNRALPFDARQALAMTLEEWEGVQDRRWLARNAREWVAEEHGRITASLRLSLSNEVAQFELLAAGESLGGARALLVTAATQIKDREQVLTLVPRAIAPLEGLLRDHGLAPQADYALVSKRTAKPVVAQALARARRGVVVSRGI